MEVAVVARSLACPSIHRSARQMLPHFSQFHPHDACCCRRCSLFSYITLLCCSSSRRILKKNDDDSAKTTKRKKKKKQRGGRRRTARESFPPPISPPHNPPTSSHPSLLYFVSSAPVVVASLSFLNFVPLSRVSLKDCGRQRADDDDDGYTIVPLHLLAEMCTRGGRGFHCFHCWGRLRPNDSWATQYTHECSILDESI